MGLSAFPSESQVNPFLACKNYIFKIETIQILIYVFRISQLFSFYQINDIPCHMALISNHQFV